MLTENGRLRAAINLGNPVLVQRRPDGSPTGVTVALAEALATQEGLALDLVLYETAGKVVEAAGADAWDIAFLAIDPKRATEIAFTEPYVTIEGVFVVAADAPFRTLEDLDRPGVRISVGQGAAYDLHLTRTLKHAEIVRAPNSAEALVRFAEDGLEAGAGIRQPVSAFAASRPGLRLIDQPFMQIRQAMALPIAKAAELPRIQRFLDAARDGGLIAGALSRTADAG